MKTIASILLLLTLGFVLSAQHASGADDPVSPEHVLAEYSSTLAKMPSTYSAQAEALYTRTRPDGTVGTKNLWRMRYCFAPKRIDVRLSSFLVDDQGKVAPSRKGFVESMIGEDGSFFYYYGQEGPPETVLYSLDGFDKRSYWTRKVMMGGQALDGYFAHDTESISDVLTQSENVALSLAPETELVDGYDCHVVTAVIEGHGEYTLWLDPANGYLPRKAVVRKSGSDSYGPAPLTNHPGATDVEFVMEGVIIEEINGIPVQVACRAKEVWTKDGQQGSTRSIDYKRENFDFNPDFEALGAFKPDLAEGTRVAHQDFVTSGLAFEWRDGEVVPALDEIDLSDIDEVIDEVRVEDRTEPSEPPSADTEPEPSAPDVAAQVPQEPPPSEAQSGINVGVIVAAVLIVAIIGCILLAYRRKRGE